MRHIVAVWAACSVIGLAVMIAGAVTGNDILGMAALGTLASMAITVGPALLVVGVDAVRYG